MPRETLMHHAPQPSSAHCTRPDAARAFTIVELLMSMAIIFLLIGVAFYALQSARRSGSRTETLNALRQMSRAYSAYADDHTGHFMPGYVDAAMIGTGPNQLDLKATLPTGQDLQPADVSSYVWRMAPYLDHAWKTYMVDYRDSGLDGRFIEEYSCGNYVCGGGLPNGVFGPHNLTGPNIGIALRPSFGLNSIYLGGDTAHGDVSASPWAVTWPPTLNSASVAAMRMSEVKSPAKIIVFAPVRAGNSDTLMGTLQTSAELGYPVLTPPYAKFDKTTQAASSPHWRFTSIATTGIELQGSAAAATTGLPLDRLNDHKIATSHLDGSVTTEELEGIGPSNNNAATRMSRWSPFAVGNN